MDYICYKGGKYSCVLRESPIRMHNPNMEETMAHRNKSFVQKNRPHFPEICPDASLEN